MYWRDSESRCFIWLPVLFKSIVKVYTELNQSRIISLSSVRCFLMIRCITLNKYFNCTASLTHMSTLSNRYKIHLSTQTRTQKDLYSTSERMLWYTHKACCGSMLSLFCHICCNSSPFLFAEFITGNLTIAQMEDSRVTTHSSSSSTDTVTRISFSLHDPSHYFKSASFVYNWDFGNG